MRSRDLRPRDLLLLWVWGIVVAVVFTLLWTALR